MNNIARYVLFFSTLLLISSCEGVNERLGLENDGIIEESLEMLIHHQSGLDLDLTPMTPEIT